MAILSLVVDIFKHLAPRDFAEYAPIRDKLQDEYYGKTHDYSKKTDLVFSKIFLPEHIPKEFSNREVKGMVMEWADE